MTDLVERSYLIRKQGSWYRPNASGYTCSAIQAGRYTLAEAERYTHPNGKDGPRDGMDYVHQDDVADPDWLAYRELSAALATMQAREAELVGALEPLANMAGGANMGEPISNWLTVAHLVAARAAIKATDNG